VDAEIQSESSSGNDNISVFQAILFAFIGGLILNLMPCVFPIISLKVLSFVSMGGESKNKIRKHSLSFCAGVVISFVLIAVALIGLKESGVFVGWGFQLQSPAIVGSLSILMFLIGIVLLMDINIGSSLTRLGSVGSGDDSYYGSFLTGVLAVVVASPCTAPFMGAAIGYALIQPSLVTIPIFLSLGLGFAAPYLMLSIKPELISSMPRPGKWMETLKEFFAFPMFATSVWLLWVFSLQTNTDALINLLVSLLIISMLIWIISKVQKSNQKNFLILLIILVVGYQISAIANLTVNKDQMNTNANLVNWDKNTEKDFKLANQAYLINFTAAWCITCQANDKIALSRPKVKSYLRDNDIEYIVADWTNRDKEILSVLNAYGRSGVPLYVYWKPGMQESKLLPAILTEQIIIDSL
jgi:thiol:disulfide interchange protein DsbD